MSKAMETGRAELILGLLGVLIPMVLTLTWWLRGGILIASMFLLADLIWRHPRTVNYHPAARIFGGLVIAGLIIGVSWEALSKQYVEEGGIQKLSGHLSDLLNSEFLRLLVAATIGGLIGNQFSPVRPRLPRKAKAEARPWPDVAQWFTPKDAMDRFTSKESIAAFSSAWEEFQKADIELETAQASVPKDDFTILEHLREGSPIAAATAKRTAAERKMGDAIQNLKEDIRRKLRDGSLIGRAVLFEKDRLPGEWEYLKPPSWAVLTFDYSPNGNFDSVSGGGKKYVGLQIGQPTEAAL